ncbi:hypothetical protein STENM36S_03484 [Streptomyces tendae]
MGATGVSPSARWPCPSSGPPVRRRWLSEPVAAAAPGVRSGVTLLPLPEPRASVVVSGVPRVTPPSAIAASDTAPAATKANRRPREAERSDSCLCRSWIRKPRPDEEGGSTEACVRAGT